MRKPLFLWVLSLAALAASAYAPFEISTLEAAPQTALSVPSAQVAPPVAPPPSANGTIPAPDGAPSGGAPTIVLDAAHGGADNGARGPNGVNEKDITLALARGIRAELTRRGYRVVMTRDGDANPSYDDRAAMANSHADPIVVSLHVASTGTNGTARVYFYRAQAASVIAADTTMVSRGQPPQMAMPVVPGGEPSIGLVPWREAQISFAAESHRLADLVQSALTQKYSGSPSSSIAVAERDLRSVAAPAIAIELSSVTVNPSLTEQMGPTIAQAIAQSVEVFHPSGGAGGSH